MPTKPANGDLEEPANPLRELDQLVKQVCVTKSSMS